MNSMFVPSRKLIQLTQNAFGRELAEKVFLNLAPKSSVPQFYTDRRYTDQNFFFDIITYIFRYSRTSHSSQMFAKEFRPRERLYIFGQGEGPTWTSRRIFGIQSRQKIKLDYEEQKTFNSDSIHGQVVPDTVRTIHVQVILHYPGTSKKALFNCLLAFLNYEHCYYT